MIVTLIIENKKAKVLEEIENFEIPGGTPLEGEAIIWEDPVNGMRRFEVTCRIWMITKCDRGLTLYVREFGRKKRKIQ